MMMKVGLDVGMVVMGLTIGKDGIGAGFGRGDDGFAYATVEVDYWQ